MSERYSVSDILLRQIPPLGRVWVCSALLGALGCSEPIASIGQPPDETSGPSSFSPTTDGTGAPNGPPGSPQGMGMGADPAVTGPGDPNAGPTSPSGMGTTPGTSPTSPVAASTPVARFGLAARLSKIEYRNTVLDVLGVALEASELDPGAGGLPDDTGDGVFKHFADKQTSGEQHALAYFNIARAIAQRTDVAGLAGRFGSCNQPTAACGESLVTALTKRLFRRPATEREQGVYSTLFSKALDEGADFEEAARWTLTALLQAPPFLFRLENELAGEAGTERELDGYELAARLAAFLWVSAPDDALLESAEAGRLTNTTGLEAEVSRMLQDPKAKRFTEAFIADFSRARLASFDGVTDEQRNALDESVTATFQHHFWEAGRSVKELFTTTEYQMNPITAQLIGATVAGPGLQTYDVSGLPERVGLLSHPGMIAGMGDRHIGSFINRGKYLMERLLCRNPVALPPGLEELLEDFNRDTEGLNEHERAAIRKTRAECWGCHAQFEPLAFGFSRFDGAGRYLGEFDEAGKPLSLAGWVPTSDEANSPQYSNVADYMQILSQDASVQKCMTEHFLAFATGRSTDSTAKAGADAVSGDYLAQGSTLTAMIAAVAQSQVFRKIRVSPNPAAANGEGN